MKIKMKMKIKMRMRMRMKIKIKQKQKKIFLIIYKNELLLVQQTRNLIESKRKIL